MLTLSVLLALIEVVDGEAAILNLGGVFSFITQGDKHNIAGSQQFAAFRMAIKEINDKNDGIFDDLLPDVQVKLAVRDGQDDFAQSVLHALDFTKKLFRPVGAHTVFSIADDNVTKGLASVLSGADVTQFTTTSTAELSKADRFPTMLRLIPSDAFQVRDWPLSKCSQPPLPRYPNVAISDPMHFPGHDVRQDHEEHALERESRHRLLLE